MSRYIDADKLKYTKIIGCYSTEKMAVLEEDIENAPTADVEPVRYGHWIVHERAEAVFGLVIPNFECSECHKWVRPDGRGKRCLECGARMDDGEKNTNEP